MCVFSLTNLNIKFLHYTANTVLILSKSRKPLQVNHLRVTMLPLWCKVATLFCLLVNSARSFNLSLFLKKKKKNPKMSFKGFPEMINCYGRNDISYESIGYISRVKLLQILSRMSSKAIQK